MLEIRFHSKSPDNGWLSNFDTRGSFSIEGATWRSVEHYYQAQKFEDPRLRSQIQNEPSAAGARKLARSRPHLVRQDWDRVKEDVMRTALRAKFGQNRTLRKSLLDTGGAALVHHSSSDPFWGRDHSGDGLNRLGDLLAEIREELRREGAR